MISKNGASLPHNPEVAGEAFGLIGINKGLDSPINLDLRLIEADQIASPQRLARSFLSNTEIVDGIESDAFGNPSSGR